VFSGQEGLVVQEVLPGRGEEFFPRGQEALEDLEASVQEGQEDLAGLRENFVQEGLEDLTGH
jgi:hypothetical protein